MAMKTIDGANVFKVGTWNRQTFTEADLDGIVRAFGETGSAGRVPLKAGHDDAQPLTEGQPALGWVTKLWRAGQDLFATFSDVPTIIYDAIRSGAYKFSSIELLKNVTKDGKKFPFVLDAIALLGADIPAVDGLQDLQRLTHGAEREFPAMKYSKKLCFKATPIDQVPGPGGAIETDLLPLTVSGVSQSDLETIASTAVPLPVWLGRAIAGHITKIVRKGDAIQVAITIAPDVAAVLNAGKYKAIAAVTGASKGILRGAELDGLDMTPEPPKFSREGYDQLIAENADLREQLREVTGTSQFKRSGAKEIEKADVERIVKMCLDAINNATSATTAWQKRAEDWEKMARDGWDVVRRSIESHDKLFGKKH